jgi:hypothetical protein
MDAKSQVQLREESSTRRYVSRLTDDRNVARDINSHKQGLGDST